MRHMIWMTLLMAGMGCSATHGATVSVPTASQAGWYTQTPESARFQLCGKAPSLAVTGPGSQQLRRQAAAFPLQPDTPVYVRLAGSVSPDGDAFTVERVVQFGSDTPVRDCPMTGTSIQ